MFFRGKTRHMFVPSEMFFRAFFSAPGCASWIGRLFELIICICVVRGGCQQCGRAAAGTSVVFRACFLSVAWKRARACVCPRVLTSVGVVDRKCALRIAVVRRPCQHARRAPGCLYPLCVCLHGFWFSPFVFFPRRPLSTHSIRRRLKHKSKVYHFCTRVRAGDTRCWPVTPFGGQPFFVPVADLDSSSPIRCLPSLSLR